jgi:IclR-like helix-turn-helix domain-containing protein
VAREVAGIVRVMRILESLAASPDGHNVKDLSRAIGCGKGTISAPWSVATTSGGTRRAAASC